MHQPSAAHRNPQSPYSRAANQKTGGAQAAHVPMIEGTDLLKDPAATEALLEDKWAGGAGFAFIDSILGSRTNAAVNKVLADFVRQKIREAVDDPVTAELLCPEETLTMGAKRQILDTNYYETYNREQPTTLLGRQQDVCVRGCSVVSRLQRAAGGHQSRSDPPHHRRRDRDQQRREPQPRRTSLRDGL